MNKTIATIYISILLVSNVFAVADMTQKIVLSGRVQLMTPHNIKEMPEEFSSLKFPYLNREYSEVLGDDSTEVSYVFQYPEVNRYTTEAEQLADMVSSLEKSKVVPSVDIIDSGIETIDYRKYFFVRFNSQAKDMKMFTFVKGTIVGERMLLCSFSCPAKEQETWAPIAQKSLDSIVILKR